jgi:uncharacterized protein (TIGR03437 family)
MPDIEFSGETLPRRRVDLTIAADAPLGTVGVVLETPSALTVFSGGIEISEPAPTPIVSFAGFTNAASFLSSPAVAGGIFTIFGQDVGPTEGAAGYFDPITGKLVGQLEGVAVFFNSVPAPLYFVSRNQLNVQAPAGLQAGVNVLLSVRRDEDSSNAIFLPTGSQSPALFSYPGGGPAVALNQDGSLNTTANPAAAGEIVTLFGAGQGALDRPLASGQAAPLDELSRVDGEVRVLMGGLESEVAFAGMAPGFVGLLQINAGVPEGASGGAAAVEIRIRGTASPAGVTIELE